MQRVYVAGHTGLVGSAVRRLMPEAWAPSSRYDLRDLQAVDEVFAQCNPTHVVMAAGMVGGIGANILHPWSFIADNTRMGLNIVQACSKYDARLIYLGSSCIYPKGVQTSIEEWRLGTGPLEETNKPYATAKIAVIEAMRAAKRQCGLKGVCLMPCNLYGPGDNFGEGGHVFASLMRKFHEAKVSGERHINIWGSGYPLREFMHVDDLARAIVHFLDTDEDLINVGTGWDLTIADLAGLMREEIYPDCRLEFDTSKPDGVGRKVLDVSLAAKLGWEAKIKLRDGLRSTYAWYQERMKLS